MTLVLPERVFAAIEQECLEHESTETGGALVGARIGPDIIIACGIPAGPKAVRSASNFAPDASFQQDVLNLLHARFSGLAPIDFQGDWHRHLGSFDRPSDRDLRTARHVVTDREWSRVEACFPIATLEKRHLRLRAFHAYRYREGFEEVAIEVVPDSDPRIRAVLVGEPEGGTT